MSARRPGGGVPVYVRPETAERLRQAADDRLMGIHALGDRLLSVGLDALPPVDSYARPAGPDEGPPPQPMRPTMCLLDHDHGPDCPPDPETQRVYMGG